MKILLHIYLLGFLVLLLTLLTKHQGLALKIASTLFWIIILLLIFYIHEIRAKQ